MFYVNINLKKLQDILRIILQDIHDVFFKENKSQIWFSVLWHNFWSKLFD